MGKEKIAEIPPAKNEAKLIVRSEISFIRYLKSKTKNTEIQQSQNTNLRKDHEEDFKVKNTCK